MLTLLFHTEFDHEPLKLRFEHSLVSLSKWESFYEKPFFNIEGHSVEETARYIEFMHLGDDVPDKFVEMLTPEHFKAVQEYINSKQTATTFRDDPNAKPSNEVITNEIIYQWLVAFNIPFDPVQHWHLNRLMTLVRVCGVKQSKPKKMSKAEQMEQYHRLNEQRRRELGTHG